MLKIGLKDLSAEGDPLERPAKIVDFELFRPALVGALGGSDLSKRGRPGFDPVLNFNMLVLGALHGNRCRDGLSRAGPVELHALLWARPERYRS